MLKIEIGSEMSWVIWSVLSMNGWPHTAWGTDDDAPNDVINENENVTSVQPHVRSNIHSLRVWLRWTWAYSQSGFVAVNVHSIFSRRTMSGDYVQIKKRSSSPSDDLLNYVRSFFILCRETRLRVVARLSSCRRLIPGTKIIIMIGRKMHFDQFPNIE